MELFEGILKEGLSGIKEILKIRGNKKELTFINENTDGRGTETRKAVGSGLLPECFLDQKREVFL